MDINERNKKLCEMYESGLTITQISKECRLSPTQLSRIFRQHGSKRKKYELDKEYFEKNKDKTVRDIAEENNLNIKRVQHLKRIAYGKKLTRGKTDFTDLTPVVDQSKLCDREWLYDQYVIKRNGAPTIAKMLAKKCSDIYRALKSNEIRRRSIRDMMRDKRKWPSSEWLKQHYIDKGWSVQRCAEEFGAGWDSIYAALIHYGMGVRSSSEQHTGSLNEFYGQSHTPDVRNFCKNVGKLGASYWVTGDVEAKIKATSIRNTIIWSDPDKRSEASKKISELCKLGKCNSKSQLYTCVDGTVLLVKSSWEVLVAKILDQCEEIAEWKYEHISIEYMDGEVVRNFIVDFWVKWRDGLETLIECKNKHLLAKDKEQLKIQSLKDYCAKHGYGYILIDDDSEIRKLTTGYKSMVEWRNNTRYYVHRKYLNEPKLFIEIMLHEIISRSCPWKPLQYNDDELVKDVRRLKDENLSSYNQKDGIHSTAPNSGGMPGRLLMTHFNTHFWDVAPKKMQPLPRMFEDKAEIYKCLNISYSENESLSTERLLREINFHCRKFGRTSHFAPGFARVVIKLLDMSGCRMFDPCCGWGGRLIGAWLEECEYSGCDISSQTFDGLCNISKYLNCDCNIYNNSCLDLDWPDCDLIFTSPPFYDIEQYVGGDQPWIIYNSRREWIDKFIIPFVGKIKTKCVLYLDGKTKNDYESIRKFDKIIEIKNRRHARRKIDNEFLCIYL